ncbi:hypothetical protein H6P81_009227 [Aristolochia fimbriata]|uniref:Uncharacterized protein n=1 Tax=Aristolochia fimbriata TaxID=158543 RepID=A0AAV7ENR5_ARIFI|nr:hypothetical protein H6P81_009227 [Aristolochia fimbriata]
MQEFRALVDSSESRRPESQSAKENREGGRRSGRRETASPEASRVRGGVRGGGPRCTPGRRETTVKMDDVAELRDEKWVPVARGVFAGPKEGWSGKSEVYVRIDVGLRARGSRLSWVYDKIKPLP